MNLPLDEIKARWPSAKVRPAKTSSANLLVVEYDRDAWSFKGLLAFGTATEMDDLEAVHKSIAANLGLDFVRVGDPSTIERALELTEINEQKKAVSGEK